MEELIGYESGRGEHRHHAESLSRKGRRRSQIAHRYGSSVGEVTVGMGQVVGPIICQWARNCQCARHEYKCKGHAKKKGETGRLYTSTI